MKIKILLFYLNVKNLELETETYCEQYWAPEILTDHSTSDKNQNHIPIQLRLMKVLPLAVVLPEFVPL